MKEQIKNFDLFGIGKELSILGSSSFKSILGSTVTLASFIVIIVVTIFFGKDFYLKETPRIVTEKVLIDNYRKINLTPEVLTIAFRLESSDGNQLKDEKGYLNFNIKYVNLTYNLTDQEWKSNTIDFKPVVCNSDLLKDAKFTEGRNLTEWLCIDFPKEGYDLGGSWSGNYVSYFTTFITNCYSKTGECHSIYDEINFLKSDNIYFSMYYPIFYFLPNDINHAANIKYVNYYTQVYGNMKKFERIFFKNYIFEDDQGWIFKDVNAVTSIAFERKETDLTFNEIIPGHEKDTRRFYELLYYFNSDYEKYYRSYMKIQELAALVGGFMKIIIFIANFLVKPYNNFLLDICLINKFLDNKSSFISTSNKKQQLTKVLHHPSKQAPKQVIEDQNQLSFNNSNLNKEDKLIEKSQAQKIMPQNVQEIDNSNVQSIAKTDKRNDIFNFKNNSFLSKAAKDNKKMNNNFVNSFSNQRKKSDFAFKIGLPDDILSHVEKSYAESTNNKTFSLSFFAYLKGIICCGRNTSLSYKEFEQASDIINQKFDIEAYIKHQRQFQSFKHIFLNYYQDLSLDFLAKPNMKNPEDMDLLNLNKIKFEGKQKSKEIKELLSYYTQQKKENSLTDLDIIILENIYEPIREFIVKE